MDGTNSTGRETGYEIYYIKEDACKLLLAGLGQQQWYGLFSDTGPQDYTQAADRTVNHMLADLYQNGIVDWKDGGVAVRQPYADMFLAMLEKKICVTIQFSDTSIPVRCCYLSDSGIVVTQKSQREDCTLGMAQVSVPDWTSSLKESCIRLEDEEFCTLTKRSSENGRIYRTIQIQKAGLRAVRMEWEQKQSSNGNCKENEIEHGNKTGKISCMQEDFGPKLWELLQDPGSQKQAGCRQ